ncbi:MAG TPA: amidohydrolase family protein [Gemmatimonadales bacterium]|jgi:imidazolonepropionase-like amidohydrolase
MTSPRLTRFGGGALLIALGLIARSLRAAAQAVALVGGTVVDGTGAAPIPNAVVLVEGERITCVGPAAGCLVPAGAQRHDVTGRFLTPGLIDAHVHFSQTGWIDGRPDGLSAPDVYPYAETARSLREHSDRFARSYLCTGVTGVFDVGGHPWTTTLPDRSEHDADGVHVRAAGPLITHASVPALNVDEQHYTFLPMGSLEDARESVQRLVALGSTAAKVWYVSAPPDQQAALDDRVAAVGAATREAGLELIVHATSLRNAKAAVRAGAGLLVHSVEDTLVDQEFLELLRSRGTLYSPTLVVGGNWNRAIASVILDAPERIDDPNGCVDPQTVEKISATAVLRPVLPSRMRSPEVVYTRMERGGARSWIMAENLRRVVGAGITVATGTDAGNPLTLHGPAIYAEMEAMQRAGMSPTAVIVASTRNGARAMQRDDIGILAAGKIADLLVLAEDPTVDVRAFRSLTHVMRAGVLHPLEDLAYR